MDAGMRHYLLLDGAQIDDLLQQIYRLELAPEFHVLYQQTRYAELAEVGPVLVETGHDSALTRHFEQHWSASAGVVLTSSAVTEELIQHLRSLVHIQTIGEAILLFRFYDPRILHLWLSDLAGKEQNAVMGPVNEFRLLAGNTWHTYTSNVSVKARCYADTPWLQLDSEQLARLNQAKLGAFEQRLLEHVDAWFPDCLKVASAQERSEWANSCRIQADRYGFSSALEVARWAGFMALLGKDFPEAEEHESYRALLERSDLQPAARLDAIKTEIQRQALVQNKDDIA